MMVSCFPTLERPTRIAITLPAADWVEGAQTVTALGVLADEAAQLIQATPASASMAAYYDAGILLSGQAADSITFTAQATPATDLSVYVVVTPLT